MRMLSNGENIDLNVGGNTEAMTMIIELYILVIGLGDGDACCAPSVARCCYPASGADHPTALENIN